MIERIVIPLDGSMTAEGILPQVRRVLHRNDSEIILVRAVNLVPMEAGMMDSEIVFGSAREYVYAQKEKMERAGVRVKAVVRMGTPIDVILEVVKEEKATMIALATHGASGISRLLVGSVAEGILRRSPVPVLAVRPFWSHELTSPAGAELLPMENLLVPVDGSDLSMASLPGVIELARLFDMRIVLLRVLEGSRKKATSAEEHGEAVKQLKALAHMVEKSGVEAVTMIKEGDPARQILDTVRLNGIQLIAMTTHGRSGLSRLVMGSVTERVLRCASVPMLLHCSAEGSPAQELVSPAGARKAV